MSNEQEFKAENEPSLDFSTSESLEGNVKPKSIQDIYEEELKTAEEQVKQENPEVTKEAKQFGHLTKEEWEAQGRDPSQWKSPEEFVQYGREFKETKDFIKALKQQNAEQSKKIDILVEAQKQTAEMAVQQAKRELEAQLKLAEDRGDIAAVRKLTEVKVNQDLQLQQQDQQRRVEEIRQVDIVFLERNKHWFNQSRADLMNKALVISKEIESFYPNISYAEKARRVEERMKFEHPEIVVNQPQAPVVSISNSSVNKATAQANTSDDDRAIRGLSAEQRAELRTIQRMVEKATKGKATYTAKEYLERNSRGA